MIEVYWSAHSREGDSWRCPGCGGDEKFFPTVSYNLIIKERNKDTVCNVGLCVKCISLLKDKIHSAIESIKRYVSVTPLADDNDDDSF